MATKFYALEALQNVVRQLEKEKVDDLSANALMARLEAAQLQHEADLACSDFQGMKPQICWATMAITFGNTPNRLCKR